VQCFDQTTDLRVGLPGNAGCIDGLYITGGPSGGPATDLYGTGEESGGHVGTESAATIADAAENCREAQEDIGNHGILRYVGGPSFAYYLSRS
jgi:hypothetical protein